jgi:hypothetical protein
MVLTYEFYFTKLIFIKNLLLQSFFNIFFEELKSLRSGERCFEIKLHPLANGEFFFLLRRFES